MTVPGEIPGRPILFMPISLLDKQPVHPLLMGFVFRVQSLVSIVEVEAVFSSFRQMGLKPVNDDTVAVRPMCGQTGGSVKNLRKLDHGVNTEQYRPIKKTKFRVYP